MSLFLSCTAHTVDDSFKRGRHVQTTVQSVQCMYVQYSTSTAWGEPHVHDDALGRAAVRAVSAASAAAHVIHVHSSPTTTDMDEYTQHARLPSFSLLALPLEKRAAK